MAQMSPAAWQQSLDKRLTDRWSRWRTYDDYFEGRHPLAFATPKFREAFGGLLREMADNWCPIVVKAKVQRLKVVGFRFGGPEDKADTDAWNIWQANNLDGAANMVHTEAAKLGAAYWLVEPPDEDSVYPRITCEHPREFIVAYAPGNRRLRVAAYKRWIDENDGYAYATLYLPDWIYKFRSQKKVKKGEVRIDWQRRPGDEGGENTLREVPGIEVPNDPQMLGYGVSDLKVGIPIQDAINKECNDMLVASEFAAYRQRILAGVEEEFYPEGHPLAGQKIPVELGSNRVFTIGDSDAKVFDLAASDLGNYIGAIEMLTQHLAAQTQTPPHYLLGKMVNMAGEALTVAESGLASKVEDAKVPFGDGHEDMMRLAFKSMGEERRARAIDAETLWANSERRSFAQTVDGAAKLKDIGVPQDMIYEELGWSPQKIARAKAMTAAEALFRDAAPDPLPARDRTDQAAT